MRTPTDGLARVGFAQARTPPAAAAAGAQVAIQIVRWKDRHEPDGKPTIVVRTSCKRSKKTGKLTGDITREAWENLFVELVQVKEEWDLSLIHI